MWFSTVRSEIESSWAIWRLVSPPPTSSAISCWRQVRVSVFWSVCVFRLLPDRPTFEPALTYEQEDG